VGYVYGVVGRPQKQATLLAAAIAGSNGSAMGFLVGRDLQMPGVDRLFWDNRDFYANPTRGFSLRGRCSRDFGWLDSSNSWTNVDAELDGYIPFQMGTGCARACWP